MSEPKETARILVVDDEDRNRRVLAAMLKADGYEVQEAGGRTLPAHFDPAVLAAFKGCVARFREIFEAHADEPTIRNEPA